MSITFDYDTWDGETESIPELEQPGTTGRVPENKPFPEYTLGILLSVGNFGYAPGSSEFEKAAGVAVEAIWIALAWFRRQGISATDLERRMREYPTKTRTYDQTVKDSVRAAMSSEVYSDPLSRL